MGQPDELTGEIKARNGSVSRAMLGGAGMGSLPSLWPKPVTIPWGQPDWAGNPMSWFYCGGEAQTRVDQSLGRGGPCAKPLS